MKKLSIVKAMFGVMAVCAVLFAGGCADPVVFSEVFQLKEGEKLYTKYNIWYDDPADISCLNIQRGSFIPLGTEIIPVETTVMGKIVFEDVKGKRYTISFSEGERLCAMYQFIEYTFGTDDKEKLLAGINPEVRKRIERGEVVPGMNYREVTLAYGPPAKIRTPDVRNESWIYWITPSKTVRLVWRDDLVKNILNVNAEE